MARSILSMIFPRRFGQWFGPLLATGAAILAVAIIILSAGWINLSASIPHPPGWALILHGVFRRSTAYHARGLTIPAEFGSPRQVAKGAAYYGRVCARCHSGPGLGQNPVALSMRPRPQYLFREIDKFPPRDLFWVVKHGVKYSGMPSWPVQDRDDEVWSVVSFLKQMPKMTTAQFEALAYGDRSSAPSGPRAGPVNGASHGYVLPNFLAPPVDSHRYTAPAIGFDSIGDSGSLIAGCVACHGADGAGRPSGAFPNIALLNKVYIRDALTSFRNGTRQSGYMQTVAVQLSDDRIAALADYYASQPRRQSMKLAPAPAMLALGRQLATDGDAKRGIGACSTCHGAEGASPKGFSALDGQFPGYLAEQLKLFRIGVRGAEPGNSMGPLARNLTDREIDAVSLYYAARMPGAPAPQPAASLSGG